MSVGQSCLIIGGYGFVGSAITRLASERGWEATPAGRDEYPGLKGSSWDVVINANGNSKKFLSDQQPADEFDMSVRTVAHSLHDLEYGLYAFLSSVDVYHDTRDPGANAEDAVIPPMELSRYGFHKYLAEELVRFNAPKQLVFRMAGFVGPGLKKNPIYDLLTGAPLRVHPDSAYQYQHTRALAETVLDEIDSFSRNGILNVAGDGLITPREVAEWIPGVTLEGDYSRMTPQRYEINIDRLKARRHVPATRETVRSFVEDVLRGKETLG